ncbi:MAG: anthranilate phosphoribosyltransferase [Phycisphaerae bacterium]
MKDILRLLIKGQSLKQDQTRSTFEAMMSGTVPPAQIGALLAIMAGRDPTVDELAGAAMAMREFVIPVVAPEDVIDTCGTGGTNSRIFNVSTTAAVVAAACGVPVAKHGNSAVSSRSGSADVLSRLGVRVDVTPDLQARCVREIGVCFCFAPRHHPAMRHVAEIRKSLGFATIFNLMGPLTNPAGARRQLVGVPRASLVRPMLEVLVRLGAVRAMVVCGADPEEGSLCELSIGGPTRVALFDGQEIKTMEISAKDVGLPISSAEDLRIDSPETSAQKILKILSGRTGAARDMVLLNTAAALWVSGKVESLREGVKLALAAINSGQALQTLEKLAAMTNSVVA